MKRNLEILADLAGSLKDALIRPLRPQSPLETAIACLVEKRARLRWKVAFSFDKQESERYADDLTKVGEAIIYLRTLKGDYYVHRQP